MFVSNRLYSSIYYIKLSVVKYTFEVLLPGFSLYIYATLDACIVLFTPPNLTLQVHIINTKYMF